MNVRKSIVMLAAGLRKPDFPGLILLGLLGIFAFRNCYFLIDVDSHAAYLYTQKLWLSHGTSIIGDTGTAFTVFLPHFDAIPYSLSLSAWPDEILFPELINLYWRITALIAVFGYTSYRFNRYYGLAAVMLMVFNDHFFFSGANKFVLLNGAIIALLFASVYNFLEAKRRQDTFRLTLALIFLSQLVANKYQMMYLSGILLVFGLTIQPGLFMKINETVRNKRYLTAIVLAVFFASLWYVKNFIVTGDPFFPAFAGRLGAFDWTIGQEKVFTKVMGGLSIAKFLKYMSYQFIWPGVHPAKIVSITLAALPLLIIAAILRRKTADQERLFELCFWLGTSFLLLLGISIACHQDPRYYRYAIGVYAFAAIFSIDYILTQIIGINNKLFRNMAMLLVSCAGYSIIFAAHDGFERPSFKDNLMVITNKMQSRDAVRKHYPEIERIKNVIDANMDKFPRSAWDMRSFNYNIPLSLIPQRPVVSYWYSTLIKWDSYKDAASIVKDLQEKGIAWLLRYRDGEIIFQPVDEYAKEAATYNLKPAKTFCDYGWPNELSEIKY